MPQRLLEPAPLRLLEQRGQPDERSRVRRPVAPAAAGRAPDACPRARLEQRDTSAAETGERTSPSDSRAASCSSGARCRATRSRARAGTARPRATARSSGPRRSGRARGAGAAGDRRGARAAAGRAPARSSGARTDRGGNGPARPRGSRSRLVAAITRRSTRRSFASPIGSYVFSCEQAQQLRLDLERQLADLVEEQRAAIGRRHLADAIGDRAGERAASCGRTARPRPCRSRATGRTR